MSPGISAVLKIPSPFNRAFRDSEMLDDRRPSKSSASSVFLTKYSAFSLYFEKHLLFLDLTSVRSATRRKNLCCGALRFSMNDIAVYLY